ncbi:MAG: riboflavin synthase [Fimbriimonadaceae bacterium]|nr:MAG: riboflavin synthase [Fimbriimonadaceae bacterium]
MFTGIIQAKGTVKERTGSRLVIDSPNAWADDPWQMGESIAVNGCCLTLVDFTNGLAFDVSEETYNRTSLGSLDTGSQVNLERAMRPVDRFGGHIVQGHVDVVGQVVEIQKLDDSWRFEFHVQSDLDRYLVQKGSVTINGVSLTVIDPVAGKFWVAVIPHTFEVTTLGQLKPGDQVNIEFDVLAKHVERLLKRD